MRRLLLILRLIFVPKRFAKTLDAKFSSAAHQTWHPAVCVSISGISASTRWLTAMSQLVVVLKRISWNAWLNSTSVISIFLVKNCTSKVFTELVTCLCLHITIITYKTGWVQFSNRCTRNKRNWAPFGAQAKSSTVWAKRLTMNRVSTTGAGRTISQSFHLQWLMERLVTF